MKKDGREFEMCVIDKEIDAYDFYEKHDIFHGSNAVMFGKLKGQTDTDYFNFLCPECDDGTGLVIIDCLYQMTNEQEKKFDTNRTRMMMLNKKPCETHVHLRMILKCYHCDFEDMIKIGNGFSVKPNSHNE